MPYDFWSTSGWSYCGFLEPCYVPLGNHVDREPPPTDLASLTSRDMPKNRSSCHYRGDEPLSIFPKPGCQSIPNAPVRVVIWGDSMALAWQPFAWAIGQRTGLAAASYSRDSCPPVLENSNGKSLVEDMLCRKFNSLVMEDISGVDIFSIKLDVVTGCGCSVQGKAGGYHSDAL